MEICKPSLEWSLGVWLTVLKIGRWGLCSIEGIYGVFVSLPCSKNELGPHAFSAAVYMRVNTHRQRSATYH